MKAVARLMKMTEVVKIDILNPDMGEISRAAKLIRAGEVIAFPTETVYGLGADAFNAAAVDKIFLAKGRPAHDPLIVHIASVDQLASVTVKIPDFVQRLGNHFWPGPLTLVVQRNPALPGNVTAELDTVAVRVPQHAVALALIKASQTAIAAPSANLFSGVSPTSAEHVFQDLNGRIPLILDGGSTTIGVESTVLDCTIWPPKVLRPGGISVEALATFLGDVDVFQKNKDVVTFVKSPGMLDKHYSPSAHLYFCLSTLPEHYQPYFEQLIENKLRAGKKVGAIIVNEDEAWFASHFSSIEIISLGSILHLEQVASHLYAALREMDARGVDYILAHDFGGEGVGLAIRDRLMRAAFEVGCCEGG